MTPEHIRNLRSQAELVHELTDAAIAIPTEERVTDATWAEKEFNKRYPRYRWQDWCRQEKKERDL